MLSTVHITFLGNSTDIGLSSINVIITSRFSLSNLYFSPTSVLSIDICSKDSSKNLTLVKRTEDVQVKERKKPKYTPLSKRQDRPDAILWLIKNFPELTDGQMSKLVGSTKGTVSLIRKRSYWNFSSLRAKDPVILGLCSQEVFEKASEKAKRRVERERKAKIKEEANQKEPAKEDIKN